MEVEPILSYHQSLESCFCPVFRVQPELLRHCSGFGGLNCSIFMRIRPARAIKGDEPQGLLAADYIQQQTSGTTSRSRDATISYLN